MKKFLDYIPRWFWINAQMAVGGAIGAGTAYLFGWPGTIGMLAGSLAWFAYEMRRNTKAMNRQMEQMLDVARNFRVMHEENTREIQQHNRPRPWMN